MKKRHQILCLILIALILLSFTGCSEKGSTPMLWKATSPSGGVVYLFGSVHAGDKEMRDLPDYVTEAFNSSDILAVELDIVALEQDAEIIADMMSSMTYEDGSKIYDHISNDLYVKAKEQLNEMGLYYAGMDDLRPYVWEEVFSAQLLEKTGLITGYGVDRTLLRKAKQTDKTIFEIETIEEQMAVMGGRGCSGVPAGRNRG